MAERLALPVMPEAARSRDEKQLFYGSVLDWFERTASLKVSDERVAVRAGARWFLFSRNEELAFWRLMMEHYQELASQNWSVTRMSELYQYFLIYAKELRFENRRYFEFKSGVLDTETGEINRDEDRHLRFPTVRNTQLDYVPEKNMSKTFLRWVNTQDAYQRVVREWAIASAMCGEHGLLMTYGQSRTGKSTAAEALSKTLNKGALPISISREWGRFYTRLFEGTTYLFDPDAKGSKQQNNKNYETLHLMASGDEIQMEEKGAGIYTSDNYGFVELVGNNPVPLNFEQSLVDRLTFCLYTYISPRGDGGRFKKRLLNQEQDWLNYAIDCTLRYINGDLNKPDIDDYQLYGWHLWLKSCNSYAEECFKLKRAISYNEYAINYKGSSRYMLSRETIEDVKAGARELSRRSGKEFWSIDFDKLGDIIKEKYDTEKEAIDIFTEDVGDELRRPVEGVPKLQQLPIHSVQSSEAVRGGAGPVGDKTGVREGVREDREASKDKAGSSESEVCGRVGEVQRTSIADGNITGKEEGAGGGYSLIGERYPGVCVEKGDSGNWRKEPRAPD